MQLAFFRIPVNGGAEAEELNCFLRTVRLLNVHREFVAQGDASFWAVAIEHLVGDKPTTLLRNSDRSGAVTAKVDFKNILSPEDFTVFARLREWRKQTATTEAVPVYTIFTNEQLAEMAKRRCATLSSLGDIEGVGKGRLDKYGCAVVTIIGETSHVADE